MSEILGITPLALEQHLEYVTAGLSTEVEDAIQADIVLWASYRNVEDVSFHPTESNEGFQMNGGTVRASIIRRIANWLSLDTGSLSSQFWVRTERA